MLKPHPARLLIVDDVAENREVLKRRFQRLEYLIEEADCGERALELIRTRAFDVVLLDVMMPGLDGFQTLTEVRKDFAPGVLPVIMVTARTTSEDVVKGLELGANDYLTKPVDLAVALARVSAQVARKRAEDASREAHNRLEEMIQRLQVAMEASETAAKAKSEFLANMSHEVRTPLNGILGIANALLDDCTAPKQRELISLIEDSARNLERLLSDVIDSARLENGKVELAQAPFALADVAQQCVDLFKPSAAAKGIVLTLDVSPGLGLVMGDAGRLQQILNNLLSNAVKFTEQGAVRCELRRQFDGQCLIEVRDTGQGFDPSLAEAIFERFRQADGGTTRRHGGSGLGLAISRDLVSLMGGSITASSEPGKGARFRVTLPLPPLGPESETPTPVGWRDEERSHRILKVLVADDNPVNRRVIELMLGPESFETTSVENGEEAVAAASQAPFDVILMDIQMPVMDGLTAIREIRRRMDAPAPIVVVSANCGPDDIKRSLAAGAVAHVGKPISPSTLFAAIDEAVSSGGRPAGQGYQQQSG
jgi:signal transduction histidine kinase